MQSRIWEAELSILEKTQNTEGKAGKCVNRAAPSTKALGQRHSQDPQGNIGCQYDGADEAKGGVTDGHGVTERRPDKQLRMLFFNVVRV